MPRANVFNSHETVLAPYVYFLFFLFEVTRAELDSIRFGSMNLSLLLFARRITRNVRINIYIFMNINQRTRNC